MVARRAPAVALVFGADQPLGAAAAVALAAAGSSVLLVGTNERALGEAVGEIAFGGGRARHLVVPSGGATASALATARERAVSAFGEDAERRFVFAPNWDPPGAEVSVALMVAAEPVVVLRAAESVEAARLAADALGGAGRAVGHVFVAPGGEHPRALAAVLGGPLGVFVLPEA